MSKIDVVDKTSPFRCKISGSFFLYFTCQEFEKSYNYVELGTSNTRYSSQRPFNNTFIAFHSGFEYCRVSSPLLHRILLGIPVYFRREYYDILHTSYPVDPASSGSNVISSEKKLSRSNDVSLQNYNRDVDKTSMGGTMPILPDYIYIDNTEIGFIFGYSLSEVSDKTKSSGFQSYITVQCPQFPR